MDFSEFFNYEGQADRPPNSDFIFLPDLSETQWAHILDATQCFRFAAGDIVVQQGDVSHAIYIVASGELEVVFIDEAGNEREISRVAALSVFGEQSFLDGLPRSATVRAHSASELRMLTRDDFDQLAARHPDLARQLVLDLGRILSLRLREMMFLAMRGAR